MCKDFCALLVRGENEAEIKEYETIKQWQEDIEEEIQFSLLCKNGLLVESYVVSNDN